jgi:predicted secreted hydrolase
MREQKQNGCRTGFKPSLMLASTLAVMLVQAEAQIPERADGFCRAEPGYTYQFPKDHFTHPCFRTEWWYFTGNMITPEGRAFGFELTFFREGVENTYPNPSRWRVDDLYIAHFAISNLEDEEFYFYEKLSRAGVGLAGADAESGRIWNGRWEVRWIDGTWLLKASKGGHGIELELTPRKGPVIHGTAGVSRKSDGPGNASHYISLTRLETKGRLYVDEESFDVSGASWMDHEFSTSQLESGQVGWDWISLQMEDGTDWMFFHLRWADGMRDTFSSGTRVDADGAVKHLAGGDFEMTPLDEWVSPRNGSRYPVSWRVVAPGEDLDIAIRARMNAQELDTDKTTGVVYWEGSIRAEGVYKGRQANGLGYLEMTGYGGPLPAALYGEDVNSSE